MDSWHGSMAGQYYYAIYSKDQLDVIAKEGLNNIRVGKVIAVRAAYRKTSPFGDIRVP
jgi:hypothetical protein